MTEKATRRKTLHLGIIGPGLVGSEFLAQILAFQKAPTVARWSVSIVAISNSKVMSMSREDIQLEHWKDILSSAVTKTDLSLLADHVSSFKNGVLVDCTASDSVALQYESWIGRGLSIITPNKKAFSGSMESWKSLFHLASEKGVGIFHESTVGAGLPIIRTLQDLVRTGDEIKQIEGIFSGTLSYLFNNFSTASPSSSVPVSFSQVVKQAKELGYTEPDPRDDLNGMDVARKVVILGRIVGLPLDLSSLPVENIVPKELQALGSASEFMGALDKFDGYFAQLNSEARGEGCVLRCVGVVDPVSGNSSVALKKYHISHPFASLTGSDNIIAFTTKRFPSPMIIQGAGAGSSVTAFGMFSDLIQCASMCQDDWDI